ncbi:MAG: AAA family ATPase, partial [Chlamydiota bacterium]
MKRLIDSYLDSWKEDPQRQSLLLRGARQVGKTYSVRKLGSTFPEFVEINFELIPAAKEIFEKDLLPERIIRDLSFLMQKPIIPGKTLLFFDEIQECPKAVSSLRYFYEMLPSLHVIAAGSLVDFTINEIGLPVGRVSSLYMYPLSFLEFLQALEKNILIEELLNKPLTAPVTDVAHSALLELLGQYFAIGGMPKAVESWITYHSPQKCFAIHQSLLNTYQQDFNKYATKFQLKYVSLLFNQIPWHVGNLFKFSKIPGDYRKRELAPSLDLLTTAGVIH